MRVYDIGVWGLGFRVSDIRGSRIWVLTIRESDDFGDFIRGALFS